MLGRKKNVKEQTDQKKKKWRVELESEGGLRVGSSGRAKESDNSAMADDAAGISLDETVTGILSPTELDELRQVLGDDEDRGDGERDIAKNGHREGEADSGASGGEVKDKGEMGQTKRKRYAWMDSDDEDISDSSEEEEEVTKAPAEAEEGKVPPPPPPGLLGDIPKEKESLPFAGSGEPDTGEDGERADWAYVPPEGDSGQLAAVRYAFISNVSWDATTADLKEWVEKESGVKAIAIHADKPLVKPEEARPWKCTQSDHQGRVYVEFSSHAELLEVLRLNEHNFQGRPVRVTKAYIRNGQFYLLHTRAHYRFFHQKPTPTRTMKTPKTKQTKVDGGFNWAR